MANTWIDVSKEDSLNISRVRDSLCAIFVSDIVTAYGKFLEDLACVYLTSRDHASTFKFPKEALTQEDWQTGFDFGSST